jgi:hypothetical protein
MTKKLSTDERLARIEEHLGLDDTNTDPVTVEGQREADEKAAAKAKKDEGDEPADPAAETLKDVLPQEGIRYGDANKADVNVPGDDAMTAENAPTEAQATNKAGAKKA